MPKLSEEKIKENVYENSLHTCEYISGYVNRSSIIKIRCLIHNIEFETAYENVARKTRAHHICPQCQEEDRQQNQVLCKCDYCGKEYYLSPSKANKSEFHFCCRECKDQAQRLSSGEQFKNLRPEHYGKANGLYSYREHAFEAYPHQCAVCGWNEDEDVLEVHHIDENRQHNDLDNLIILCPNCHGKLTSHKYKLVNRCKIEKNILSTK